MPWCAPTVVESKGDKLVLWGGLMHVAAAHFSDPSVSINIDTDSPRAAQQRRKAYADAAQIGYRAGAAHLSFPGLGCLRAEGRGYAWLYVRYAIPR